MLHSYSRGSVRTCGYLFIDNHHRAVADLGQAWEKVSLCVGRMSSDCRDRYRNHLANRDIRITGKPTLFDRNLFNFCV